jgi:hypothetical protein
VTIGAKGVKKTTADSEAMAMLEAAVEDQVHEFEVELARKVGEVVAEQVEDYKARWGEFAPVTQSGLVVTLPVASKDHIDKTIWVKNLSSGNVTVRPGGDDEIDGEAADVTLPPGAAVALVCTAAEKLALAVLPAAIGEIYISSSAATAIATAGTFVVVAGTYSDGILSGFSHGTNGRLQWDGPTRNVEVSVTFSFDGDTADVYDFRLAVNGTTKEKTETDRNVSSGAVNTVGAASCQGVFQLSKGDYVELWVTTESNNSVNATVRRLNMMAKAR